MFIKNKYYGWYVSIIEKARNREVVIEYTENHHIIPKSFGGTDDNNNIVTLTGREHFICHLLLVKFTHGKNKYLMGCALSRMAFSKSFRHSDRYLPNSIMYELARKLFSVSQTGIKRDPSVGIKISQALKGRKHTLEHTANVAVAQRGRKESSETRLKKSQAHLGKKRKAFTLEHKENIGKSKVGKKLPAFTLEHKDKIRAARVGKPRSEATKLAISRGIKIAKMKKLIICQESTLEVHDDTSF